MLRFKLDLRDKEPTLTDYLEFKMYFLEVELESLTSELAIYSKKKELAWLRRILLNL